MKILVITSYYPPSRLGWGYMQLCEEVTDRLAAGQDGGRPGPICEGQLRGEAAYSQSPPEADGRHQAVAATHWLVTISERLKPQMDADERR